MKTLIIYMSMHHGNTEKVAKLMARVLNAKLVKLEDANRETLDGYDLVGFGSGVYGSKAHKDLFEFVEGLPDMKKKAFVFSTSGGGKEKCNDPLKELLSKNGFDVVGSFACRGFCTWGPFKLFGGSGKGRPNEEDLKKAREFVDGLKT
jgi:flavodoxin